MTSLKCYHIIFLTKFAKITRCKVFKETRVFFTVTEISSSNFRLYPQKKLKKTRVLLSMLLKNPTVT